MTIKLKIVLVVNVSLDNVRSNRHLKEEIQTGISMKEPDISDYSESQLIEALESVDDLKFPRRAEIILTDLLESLGLDKSDLLTRYETDNASMALALMTWIGLDTVNTNQTTHEKILRILRRSNS